MLKNATFFAKWWKSHKFFFVNENLYQSTKTQKGTTKQKQTVGDRPQRQNESTFVERSFEG